MSASGPPGSDPARLRRRFSQLAALNILSNLTVPLTSLVDTALLGHLPDIRFLAGVALAGILFDYIYWSFGFLRMGTTGVTAQAVGRADRREVYLTLYRSLIIALALGLLILMLQPLLREGGFALLASTAEVEEAGREYFRARIWAAPAVLANFAFLGWYLGREQSGNALIMAIVANSANIALDYLFIIRLDLAAAGAGWATALSQYLMLATALALFVRERPDAWVWSRVLERDALASLFLLNRDLLLRTVALLTTFALFFNFSAMLGTVTLAANTILQRLLTLAAYLIDGAAFATESLAGIFLGNGDRRSLDRLRRLALTSGVALALPFAALVLLRPAGVYALLTSHRPTIELAARLGPWVAPTLLIGSLAYIYDGYLLGMTQGRLLRNSMLGSTLFVFVPVALVALRLERPEILWVAMTLFMAARVSTLAWAERRLRQRSATR